MSHSAALPAGWWAECQHCPSPNFNARPADSTIDLLVIHNISLPAGEFACPAGAPSYPSQLFTNTLDCRNDACFADLLGVQVSAHFLIEREGAITQFVSTRERAWHAGLSSFEGRENCNDFSVGVELVGSDFVPFEAAQYSALVRLTRWLLSRHPITAITGHQHIAPTRKTDPGPFFEWAYYQSQLAEPKVRFVGAVA